MKILYIISLLLISVYTQAQIVDIPDANFKNALLNYNPPIDTNNDGEIQVSEAEVVNHLSISFLPITSLEGIQSFTSLEHLSCAKNYNSAYTLTEIDLSNNIYLTYLNLRRNDLEVIDLSNNIDLTTLVLDGNRLTSIDLLNNINLIRLQLVNMIESGGPGINYLDLSSNINLRFVGVQCSNLSFLNIKNGNNQNIEDLIADCNPSLFCIMVDDENYNNYPECIFNGSVMVGWCIGDGVVLSEDCELGVIENTTNSFTIYPNPVQNVLFIETQQPIETVKIYNLQGQLITEGSTSRIDVSQLSAGLYFVQVAVAGKREIKKFVKE